MHELSIATELLAACARKMPPNSCLRALRIAVGELSSVEPELLRFAFAAVVDGTAHAGASLVIDWCPAQQVCGQCGVVAERQPGTWLRQCPHCQQLLQIRGGNELDLIEIDVDEAAGQDVGSPP